MDVAAADSHADGHGHRGLLALIAVSLLLNALLVAGVVVMLASGASRDWIAEQLDLATRGDVSTVALAASDARAAADGAAVEARKGPSDREFDRVRARLSDVNLRLSALASTLDDQKAGFSAACDWARLQETNFAGSSLANVFFDYSQSVCLN